jgi:uncharacterized protein (UPF0210 family)
MSNKIIRTICYFQKDPSEEVFQKLDNLEKLFVEKGFSIQTKRLCSPNVNKIIELDKTYASKGYFLTVGSIDSRIDEILKTNNTAFNYDLTNKEISLADVEILFNVIKTAPAKTFTFTYVFNNPPSSPFFPSANYERDGFSIGLQPTDLAENCSNLSEWLEKMKEVWNEINDLMKTNPEFLGIDSSIAPLFTGKSSLINFIKKISGDFNKSTTSDIYTKITQFIKTENSKPIGLCGLMFPCLEDFELADEYEKGNFNIERNIYLSLHSGLGIDTYPIGVDEKPERILEILNLIQSLSNKYKKPLSARFVSDGKTKIGERTDFKNQYLKDVVVKSI